MTDCIEMLVRAIEPAGPVSDHNDYPCGPWLFSSWAHNFICCNNPVFGCKIQETIYI